MNKKDKKLSAVELGNRIRKLRKNKNLSQRALADRIGTYSTHVGKMERGESAPGEEYRRKLEEELGNLGIINAEGKEVVKQSIEEIDMEDQLIEMARLVLRSRMAEAAALHANIVAFYTSLMRLNKSLPQIPTEDPQQKGSGRGG